MKKYRLTGKNPSLATQVKPVRFNVLPVTDAACFARAQATFIEDLTTGAHLPTEADWLRWGRHCPTFSVMGSQGTGKG